MLNPEQAFPILREDRAEVSPFTKLDYSVFALIVTLFIAIRFWHLTACSLWGDEIFSINGIRQEWGGLFAYLIKDVVHPPLFYLILKVWVAIGGESLLWLKLLPLLISTITLLPIFLLCRELNLRALEINFALLLIALNGYTTYYAQEVRMYGLLQLFTITSLWLLVRFINSEAHSQKWLLALFASNLLLIYSHYFGWLVVGTEFVFLLFWNWKRLRPFAISTVILAVCFSPWAYLVKQGSIKNGGVHVNVSWIPRPHWENFATFYGILNGRMNFRWSVYLGVILFAYPVVIWAGKVMRKIWREEKERNAAFWVLVVFAFLPTAITYIASKFLAESAWVNRYFIIVAAPYLILVAAAVYRVRPYWLRTTTFVLMSVWAAVSGFNELGVNSNAWDGSAMGSRIAWEPVIHQVVEADPTSGDIQIFALETKIDSINLGYYNITMPIQYYSESISQRKIQVYNAITLEDLQCLTSPLKKDHFWIALFDSAKVSMYQRLLQSIQYEVDKSIEVDGTNGKRLLLLSAVRR